MRTAPQLDGSTVSPEISFGRTLPLGTRLRDYEISAVHAEGRCHIDYLAWDHSLERQVAIKEYFPAAIALRTDSSPVVSVELDQDLGAFRVGLKSFVNEARLLARFDHPSLLKVYRFWEDNGTAYMVTPFYEGPTLQAALASLGYVPGEAELREWLRPVLNAMSVLHEGRTWHQNIGPDEILLTPIGPLLLGLAAAERSVAIASGQPSMALKPGFAAIEQYGGTTASPCGPWTDIYALSAVLYAAITGLEPPAAPQRQLQETLQPLAQLAAGLYSAGFLAAIDQGLELAPENRPSDHLAFRTLMGDMERRQAPDLAPRIDPMHAPFTGDVNELREVTVPDHPLLLPSTLEIQAFNEAGTRPRGERRLLVRDSVSPPTSLSPQDGNEDERSKSGQTKKRWFYAVAATTALLALAGTAFFFATAEPTRPAPRGAPVATVPTAKNAALSVSVPVDASVPTPALASVPAPVATVALPASAAASPVVVSTALPPPPSSKGEENVATPAERKARCLEVLQKASLEPITAAETIFFKRECK